MQELPRWLLTCDLSSFTTALKTSWTNKCLVADRYASDEPWRRIQNPDVRTYAILLWLQNELLRPAHKTQTEQASQQCATIASLKKALEDEVLQGATLSEYAQCWAAWASRKGESLTQLRAIVESKRAEWRAACEVEAKQKYKQLMRKNAEIMRERAPGFSTQVNWFALLPIYNHTAHNDQATWGYCQATGQDRKKVRAFLKAKNQKAIAIPNRKGPGRRLPHYGFETSLLVLNEWLGNWLLSSPDETWYYQDSDIPGKTFCMPDAERVCEAIYRTVWHAACQEHTDDQAIQFCALMLKHLKLWKGKVKDPYTLGSIKHYEQVVSPSANAWKDFVENQRARAAEIDGKIRAGYKMKNGVWVKGEIQPSGPMPYVEVRHAFKRYREFLG